MSFGVRARPEPLSLFGPYYQRESQLADETGLFEYRSATRYVAMRSRYDSPAMRWLLLNLDREIDGPAFRTLKHDRTTTVGITSRDGRALVVKRYNTKNPWHFLRRSVRRSRARNCFDFARRLLQLDVPVAPPVALVEARLGPLKGRSWLISEFVHGEVCLDFVTAHASQHQAAEIAARLERIFQALARARITHGDMKATNFILREKRIPVLLDLDGMRYHDSDASYQRGHERDVARFRKNWRERPDLAACFNRVQW